MLWKQIYFYNPVLNVDGVLLIFSICNSEVSFSSIDPDLISPFVTPPRSDAYHHLKPIDFYYLF